MNDAAEVRSVLVCGAGTMGSWIALEAARAGAAVCLHDPQAASLEVFEKTRARGGTAPPRRAGGGSVRLASSLDDAARDVDLVIECIPEKADLKAKLFRALYRDCPERTILTSNTSSLDPESFLVGVNRRDRFACFHFYRPGTAVEIMPVRGTSEGTLRTLERFARAMGEVPVTMKKSSPGYLLGAILGTAIDVALGKVAEGAAEAEDVDRIWMAVTGMEMGLLGTLDLVGLDTSLLIRRERLRRGLGEPRLLEAGIGVPEKMVSQGRLGMKAGRGFYTYPDPAYRREDFLRRR